MALLDDINTVLETGSVVAGATGWEISLGTVAPTPDKIVAVLETGGFEVDQYSDPPVGEPTFQVLVRGIKGGYAATRTKMQEVFDTLNQGTIGSSIYVFALSSGPISLGVDDNERPELSWNFRVRKILS